MTHSESKGWEEISDEFRAGFNKTCYEEDITTPDDPMYPIMKYCEDFLQFQKDKSFKEGRGEEFKKRDYIKGKWFNAGRASVLEEIEKGLPTKTFVLKVNGKPIDECGFISLSQVKSLLKSLKEG